MQPFNDTDTGLRVILMVLSGCFGGVAVYWIYEAFGLRKTALVMLLMMIGDILWKAARDAPWR